MLMINGRRNMNGMMLLVVYRRRRGRRRRMMFMIDWSVVVRLIVFWFV